MPRPARRCERRSRSRVPQACIDSSRVLACNLQVRSYPLGVAMTAQQIIQRLAMAAGPAVVGLRDGARAGSGLIVGPERVLTLTRNARRDHTTVDFADGRRERARVSAVDPDLGVAILEVPTGESPVLAW